jgi:poly(3-hydroxybutyrate) depolymerase
MLTMLERPVLLIAALAMLAEGAVAVAQVPPYDVFPAAVPPYYRVRYDAGTQPGELVYPVNHTIWIPPGVKMLRGVVIHQHGCGEGSCKSGLTGAYDLHWQALARRHGCALLAPAYEQPDKAECQMWCDPRNGSAARLQQALADLGADSGHPELATVPWALWGHSGGGHWCGGMVMLHPERVAAAWLRSGVPLLEADPASTRIRPHELPDPALGVPIMCNPGTKEGVTVKDGRFAGVWPANEKFFGAIRAKGGLVGVAVDPLSAHECGNQRYLAIPWLDACLTARLPPEPGAALRPMPTSDAWLGPITGGEATPAASSSTPLESAWLPNAEIARKWMQYVADTAVTDTTPPPAPRRVRLRADAAGKTELVWEAEADPESGLAGFVVERDGTTLAKVPERPVNPFGRPLFQNLQYSDTPTQPLVEPRFVDSAATPGMKHVYRVRAVNTTGLESPPSEPAAVSP